MTESLWGRMHRLRIFFRDVLRILRQDTSALVGGMIILVYCVIAIIGPDIVHLSTAETTGQAYLGPSLRYPLGTGPLGHNVLSEIILGTRPIMEVGIAAAVITMFIGVTVGLISGFMGGFADNVIMRITDVFLTIPGLPLVIVVAAIIHTSNPIVLAGILSITAWAGLARAVRSQALSLREREFLEASKIQGMPLRNMIGRQLLPNIGPYVAIHFLLDITGAIYAEVGLFLLGIVPISGTNWGIMINLAMSEGALYTSRSLLYLLSPMAAIVILQMAFAFFTRALDIVFNPRMRVQ